MVKRISDNQTYLQETEFANKTLELQAIIDDPVPYKKIIHIPDLAAWLEKRFEELLLDKKSSSKSAVQNDHDTLLQALNNYGLSETDRMSFKDKIKPWYKAKYIYIDERPNFERLDAAIIQSTNSGIKNLGRD